MQEFTSAANSPSMIGGIASRCGKTIQCPALPLEGMDRQKSIGIKASTTVHSLQCFRSDAAGGTDGEYLLFLPSKGGAFPFPSAALGRELCVNGAQDGACSASMGFHFSRKLRSWTTVYPRNSGNSSHFFLTTATRPAKCKVTKSKY